jgi:aminopeptidase YwaD
MEGAMKRGTMILVAFFLMIFTAPGKAQDPVSLVSEDVLRALDNEISGERALEYVREIARFRRDQASNEYHHAAEWVLQELQRSGLDDARIESYPADGESRYYMYPSSPGWDIDSAELWIVEPVKEKLTSYAEIPVSIARYSHQADVTAELIWVDRGTSPEDYEATEVRGKVVFASGDAGAVARLAVDRFGALGVVTINMRYAHDESDHVSRLHLDTETPTFAFGLSHRRGEELRDRLLSGEKIVVHAKVDAEVHPGRYENVVATIPGTSLAEEEVLFTAHLCHYKPGANDNASGSACILEIARALRKLIDTEQISRPKRTLRFLWVPEMSGSIAYAHEHPEIVSRMVAGINLDMVGQHLNDNNATFFLHRTPRSQPHFVNDVLTNVTELVAANNVQALIHRSGFPDPVVSLSGTRDAFRYRIFEFVGGSDQWIFNDSLIGVPSVFFLVWPDRYYHTSADTPEKCDPTQLKRSSFIGAAAATYLVDDLPHNAQMLAGEVGTRVDARIALEMKRAFGLINKATDSSVHEAFKEANNIVEQAFQTETATLESVKDYSKRDKDIDEYVDVLVKQVKDKRQSRLEDLHRYYTITCKELGAAPQQIQWTAEETEASRIVPRRDPELRGPLGRGYLEGRLGGEARSGELSGMDSRMSYEILNFIDGNRSVLDIRNAVSAEYEPVPVERIKKYIELLAKAGVVNLSP